MGADEHANGTLVGSKEQLVLRYGSRKGEDVIVFGTRPLDMEDGNRFALFDGPLADQLNLSGIHEEVILITGLGDVITRGFHGSGKGYTSDPRFDHFLSTNQYRFGHPMTLPLGVSGLDILNRVGALPRFSSPDNYGFLSNNCQDYAGFVRGAVLEAGGWSY